MRWIGFACATLVLALVVAGCGGSNDSESGAAADTTVTETSTDTSASTDATSTDATSTDTTATDTSGIPAGLTGECKDLVEASQKFGAAVAASTSGGSGDLEATAAAYEEFAKQAPDELKDDFEALGRVMTEYAAAIDDLDLKPGKTPNAAQIAKLVKLGQAFSSEDVQNASTAIATWSTANCSTTP
jgi:hypothetical protein